ncbi:MAG: calcium-binding EGF-like domain-containing protein [Deltaproteobacteria bacterium]|nr:calcium-binding EGF-like domain-containing protein [Deltaproteobacteria bacterium]MBW2393348.1 calcium-binding EGF-like domain-containing protein [Deltaproteobacteria bacterium]
MIQSCTRKRAGDVVRTGFQCLTIVALITLGAAQVSARPPQCTSDRDCAHLRNTICGEAGQCVGRRPAGRETTKTSASACIGTTCARGSFCEDQSGRAVCVDPCKPNLCVNGGSCKGKAARTAVCSCPAGWTGKHCDQNIDECLKSPCQHGVCEDDQGGYECVCEQGWAGSACDQNTNDCVTDPCQNGAACVDGNDEYSCACTDGWTGQNCDIQAP